MHVNDHFKSYFTTPEIQEFYDLFANDDSASIKSETEKCDYCWDDKTAELLSRCIQNYTYYENQANGLSCLIYHIKEFVLGIFVKSDWAMAKNRLAGYFSLVHYLNVELGRPLGCVADLSVAGYYHELAENVLRYRLNYAPKIEKGRGYILNPTPILKILKGDQPTVIHEELPNDVMGHPHYNFRNLYHNDISDYKKR